MAGGSVGVAEEPGSVGQNQAAGPDGTSRGWAADGVLGNFQVRYGDRKAARDGAPATKKLRLKNRGRLPAFV